MYQSSPHSRQEIKELGSRFVRAVRAGGGDSGPLFERLAALPGSSAAYLAPAAAELCAASSSRNPGESYRCQLEGARLVTQCGLSFESRFIKEQLLPRLTEVPPVLSEQSADDLWPLRLHRVRALCQIAPALSGPLVDDALRAAMLHAELRGEVRTDLFVPLAFFEEAFRVRSFDEDSQLRHAAQSYCLGSIAGLFELTVEAIAEAEPESFERIPRILPWTTIAAVSLCTVLPSVIASPSEESAAQLERIVDSAEWILRRPNGFPGVYFNAHERCRFEAVRSLVGLAMGALVVGEDSYLERLQEMRLPRCDGGPNLGTAFLHSLQQKGVARTVEQFKGVTEAHMKELAQPNGLDGHESVEIVSLAWHLGVGEEQELHKVMEFSRNPAVQLLVSKALNGDSPSNW